MTQSAISIKPSLAENTLTTIARSLVSLGQYNNTADAIKDMALTQIDAKITRYQEKIQQFENKYRINFDDFTQQLKNQATIADEDEWFEWEAALSMLKAWQKVRGAIQSC
ncbi:MAG: hypothetical protein B6243_11515 [Anaerolineaceae bacterium 4572_5.2]|nr:MAG: hypothetical protein B6243_11515 [Anaerolineaceae bacterium 4572_5.2]